MKYFFDLNCQLFKKFIVFFTILLLISVSEVHAQDFTSGKLIEYDFTEAETINGNTVVRDLSGNNNHGILYGNYSFSAGRIVMNEAKKIDDWIKLPASPFQNSSEITMVAKVRMFNDSADDQGHVIFSVAKSDTEHNNMLIMYEKERLVVIGNNIYYNTDQGTGYENDKEYIVIVTLNHDTDKLKLYINGTLLSDTTARGMDEASFNYIVLGQEQDSIYGTYNAQQSLQGYMDDFILYDRILSQEDIDALMANMRGGLVIKNSGEANEDEESEIYSVRPDFEPEDNVRLKISSADTGEITVSPQTLDFTTSNWNSPKTFTVTGVDDNISDGNQNVSITLDFSESTDTDYAGARTAKFFVINRDNESPGIKISHSSGSIIEGGSAAFYSAILITPPNGTVEYNLSIGNSSQATFSPSKLTFNANNWNSSQNIQITAVDDNILDGTIQTNLNAVINSTGTSDTTGYKNVNDYSLTISIEDNDSPSTVISTNILEISEDDQGSFDFSLGLEPSGNIIYNFATNSEDIEVTPSSFTFTTSNWSSPTSITVRSLREQNNIAEAEQTFFVTASPDSSGAEGYKDLAPDSITVHVEDDDIPGIQLGAVNGSLSEDGGQASFGVRLTATPENNVRVNVSLSSGEASSSHTHLDFTPENHDAFQTIRLTGLDDQVADGNSLEKITLSISGKSQDSVYVNAAPSATIELANTDNDTAGFSVSSVNNGPSESGGQGVFTVRLNSQPFNNVILTITASQTDEVNIVPSTLTFTEQNWAGEQSVQINGRDDFITDGDVPVAISFSISSDDRAYEEIILTDVTVSNTDNETPELILSAPTGNISESGESSTAGVSLGAQPTGNVRVRITNSDSDEVQITPETLVFTPNNFSSAKFITIEGLPDDTVDGNQSINLNFSIDSATVDEQYRVSGLNEVMTVTNLDRDTASVITTALNGTVSEDGSEATYSVKLNSIPSSPVNITISSSDQTEVSVSPVQLSFNQQNRNGLQTVTLKGLNDNVADGNIPVTISMAASSEDPNYDSIVIESIPISNSDNDSAGYIVSAPDSITVSEAGDQSSFSIKLTSEPSSPLKLGIKTIPESEASVSLNQLTFNSANWNSPQEIILSSVDEQIRDRNQQFHVRFELLSSPVEYNSTAVPADLSGIVNDNESAGFVFRDSDLNLIDLEHRFEVNEQGGSKVFKVSLTSQPIDDVELTATTNNEEEGEVFNGSMIFNSDNWDSPQSFTIKGKDDEKQDGNIAYEINFAISSSDPNYDTGGEADSLQPLKMLNNDDDIAGYLLSENFSELSFSETEQDFHEISVTLTTEPLSPVTLSTVFSNPSEFTAQPSSIVIDQSNWKQSAIFKIMQGSDDKIAKGNIEEFLSFNVVSSASDYSSSFLSPPRQIEITRADNDNPALEVQTDQLYTTEKGDSMIVQVRLNYPPIKTLNLALSLQNNEESEITPLSLAFDKTNYDQWQSVVVSGKDDDVSDGNQLNRFVITPPLNEPTVRGFPSLVGDQFNFVNVDDDRPKLPKPAILIPQNKSTISAEEISTANIQIETGKVNLAEISYFLKICENFEMTLKCKFDELTDDPIRTHIDSFEESENTEGTEGRESLLFFPMLFLPVFRRYFSRLRKKRGFKSVSATLILFAALFLGGCLKSSNSSSPKITHHRITVDSYLSEILLIPNTYYMQVTADDRVSKIDSEVIEFIVEE